MPKEKVKDKLPKIPKRIADRLFSLGRQMNGVYKDTYSMDPVNKDEIERVGSDIEDNISKILTRNGTSDVADISNLWAAAHLRSTVNSSKVVDGISDFFNDRSITDQLVNSYVENKWLVELDREIDIVCKYMPKLNEALDAIKDAVLTADNFDKEYLTFNSPQKGPDDSSTFVEEIEGIKRQYGLYEKVERWYENASKYGEQLVYKVPYSKAIAQLLDRKNSTRFGAATRGTQESYIIQEGALPRDFQANGDLHDSFLSAKEQIEKSGMSNLRLEIRKDSILTSAVNESAHMRQMLAVAEQTSIINEAKSDSNRVLSDDYFQVPEKIKDKDYDSASQDGMTTIGKDRSEVRVPGLLLKDLKRQNVIFLYMDDICLGYYYIEVLDRQGKDLFSDNIFDRKNLSATGYTAGSRLQDTQSQGSATDELLRYVSSAIVANLDDKFINNNAHLKKEIYSVLKHNEMFNSGQAGTVRVTYLAPNDVEHIFFKQDPDTHRGISDVQAGLIPAKLWCCLYIANTIGILTRGQDKRVYYVKQNVEQNIAQTLLNVINQIKKQNFNIMQIENMNSILGITGKYNDYIIPVGPSGDPPVQMEVMEGQNIDPQTELMDKLEENTINSIGIPIELVTARLSLEFATQLTMSNSKFLRFVFKRQSKFEQHIGNIVTDIYNTEYETDNNVIVRCVLPAPIMLNINNLNQIIELLNNQAQTLSQIAFPNPNEEDIDTKRAIWAKNYVFHKIGNYLKQNELQLITDKTNLEYRVDKPKTEE